VGLKSCTADGQVLKWDSAGGKWECKTDNNTTYDFTMRTAMLKLTAAVDPNGKARIRRIGNVVTMYFATPIKRQLACNRQKMLTIPTGYIANEPPLGYMFSASGAGAIYPGQIAGDGLYFDGGFTMYSNLNNTTPPFNPSCAELPEGTSIFFYETWLTNDPLPVCGSTNPDGSVNTCS
jgi:hypothetical protein